MHESSSSSSSDTSEPLARSDSASTINVSNKSRSRGVSSKGFAITLTRPPPPTSSSSNKRRRQNKEEQAFNAANIQQSLADAGRPPMSIQGRRERALPKYLGAVDMDTAKLITSTQFDNENEDTPSSSSSSSVNDKYDVQSMHMYANLIQSTKHYYTVSNDEDITTTTTTTRSHHAHAHVKTQSSRKLGSTSYNNENDEDNSGMSTWTPPTPTSALNDSLNAYLRQNIDNDNRSDNLSSDMADNSTSSDSLSSSDDGSTADDPQQDEQEEDEKDQTEHITIVG